MSEPITFVPTKFVDVDPTTGEDIETSYGYRLFDAYDTTYNNRLTAEEFQDLTPLAAWELIQSNHVDDDFERAIRDRGGFLFARSYVEISSLE